LSLFFGSSLGYQMVMYGREIKIIIVGIIFISSLSILNPNENIRQTEPKITWQEFFDRLGVFIQKVFIGFSISILLAVFADFALSEYCRSLVLKDFDSGKITKEEYDLSLSTYIPLLLLGGTVACLVAGQIGVFSKNFSENLYDYKEIRSKDDHKGSKSIPYGIRLGLMKRALFASFVGFLLGAPFLGQIFIESYKIFSLYQVPFNFSIMR
jgi:hypothetical protein